MEYIPNTLKRNTVHISLFLVGLLAPLVVFYILYVTPFGSVVIEDYLMHSVLASTIIGFSFYTSWYYYRLYIKTPRNILLFSSLSTLVFAIIFMTHAYVLMPHGMSPKKEMFFDISEHYSLFLSALFFIGVIIPSKGKMGFLYDNRKKIYLGVVAMLLALMAAVFATEDIAKVLYGAIDNVVIGTGVILMFLALFLLYEFSRTQNLLLLYFIFGFTVIASSGYIPLFYDEGNLIWWFSHLAFPIGYIAIFVGLINYEREDLDFGLFFGEVPFYRKIGTKLMVTIFAIGLAPLLVLGLLMFVSAQNSPSSVLLFRFVLMISMLSVLSAFFSFYFASKLILPLKKLREGAVRIMKGEEGAQVEIKTGDEVETLADAFNGMSLELKQLHEGMEKTINEQTAEIGKKLSSLEETKKAMFNLLEDSKILEENLAEEKANVEQKVVERTLELKEERARLFSSINSLSLGFAISDTAHNIFLSNNAMVEILGLSGKREISRERLLSTIGKVFEETANKCINEGKECELKEIAMGDKILRGIISPISTPREDSRIIGYVFLLEDITEAKTMERSRDEFFAVASHELRTPLTAIRGNTEMMMDMDDAKINDKEVREMLSDMQEASIRLIGIINDFLDVSRIEQGNESILNTKFDISKLVGKVVTTNKNQALYEKKHLELIDRTANIKLPLVIADQGKTEQVLVNLVGNAIKFTDDGRIEIKAEKDGNFVKISVTDTGRGVLPQNQHLLFKKFQSAGEEVLTRDVTKSTGLGLYISRLLIEKMGGKIGLEGSTEKGSIFFFTLPIAS